MDAIDSVENERDEFHNYSTGNSLHGLMDNSQRSDYASGRSSGRGLFSGKEEATESRRAPMTGNSYGFKINLGVSNQARDAAQNLKSIEQEEEDAFMAEDPNTWDVFLDAKKFERREEILQIRKKREIDEELSQIRSHREMNEENQIQFELKNKIQRLQEKIDYRDDLIA